MAKSASMPSKCKYIRTTPNISISTIRRENMDALYNLNISVVHLFFSENIDYLMVSTQVAISAAAIKDTWAPSHD
jgi:hypothetical protein